MKVDTLKTNKEYMMSLERFEEIFQATPGSNESVEADKLALLIKKYEDKNYPIIASKDLD